VSGNFGKPFEKHPLGTLGNKWEINIKVDVKGTDYEGMRWKKYSRLLIFWG
jgi:hypothetical protein